MKRLAFGAATVVAAAALLSSQLAPAFPSTWASAVVDTTAPSGEVSLSAAQSASVTINLSVTGNQVGTATFKVNTNWSLSGGSFTGSSPQTFTVPPRGGGAPATTFSTTGTVSVAPGQGTGDFTLSIPAFDITNTNQTGGKLDNGSAATYLVKVVAPSDSTPPVITPNVSGTAGSNGWYTGDVSVSWSVTEPDSTVSSTTGCGDTTIDADTAGTTLTCSATSSGGTATRSVTIKRDATAPTLVATPSAAPNGVGFNNSAVEVTYTCSDVTSGLAEPCPEKDYATTDGTHSFSHVVHDQAGNSSSVSTTVNLDATKPSISGSAVPAANEAGWNNSDVTVTFTCFDATAEIKSCVADGSSPIEDHITLTAEGAGQSASGTAADNADNTNTATVSGINIDKTAPVIVFLSRTPANANDWSNSDVTVTWGCSDTLSGVVDPTVSKTLNSDGAGQTAAGTCEDLAGNTASAAVQGINIDKTAPTIAFFDRAPSPNGAGWSNTDVTVTWTCSDAISGVVLGAVSQAVWSEGANQSVTGTCEDLAGNSASDTAGGINIDKTVPNAPTLAADGAPEYSDWFKDTVTVTSTDNGDPGADPSGVDLSTVAPAQTFMTSGSHTMTDNLQDMANNESAEASLTVNVDADAPVVSLSCPSSVVLGSTASATWTATDVHSGLAGADHGSVALATNTVGSKTATAPAGTAADNVGHESAAATCAYAVVYDWDGFLQPINDTAHTGLYESKFKLGSTVPVKFVVTNAAGQSIQSATPPQFHVSSNRGSCDTQGTAEAVPGDVASSGTAYKWSDSQYNFNFSTKGKTAGEYRVWVTGLDDGVNHYVDLCLTK